MYGDRYSYAKRVAFPTCKRICIRGICYEMAGRIESFRSTDEASHDFFLLNKLKRLVPLFLRKNTELLCDRQSQWRIFDDKIRRLRSHRGIQDASIFLELSCRKMNATDGDILPLCSSWNLKSCFDGASLHAVHTLLGHSQKISDTDDRAW